ncbi:hypothetical protein L9F63_017245, partial [Diploptera punctata]
MPGMSSRKLFRSTKVLLKDGMQEAGLLVGEDGKINKIFKKEELATHGDIEVLDVGDLVIMPGIVDSHVHVNEPGRTNWEGYWTATRAASVYVLMVFLNLPT